MKRKLAMLLAGAMVCGMLAGCGSSASADAPQTDEGTASVSTEVSTEASTEQVATTPGEEEEAPSAGMARSYLNGQWVDEAIAGTRPVGVMVENSADSQPSYGIGSADVIYEFEAEGGIPRMFALFENFTELGLEKVGNIRSCREYFAYTAKAWDAIYVHCGAALQAKLDLLDKGYLDNIWLEVNDGGYSFRDMSGRSSRVHALFCSSEGVGKSINKRGYSTTYDSYFNGYFNFNTKVDEVTLDDGEDCAVIDVPQGSSRPWFVYNEEEGVYYKNQYKKAQIDALTGDQLTFKNVIVQECTTAGYFDSMGHDRLDIGIVGTGHGWYVTNGKAIEIKWVCDGIGEVTHYYDMNGDEITLNRGKTWVDVINVQNAADTKIYAEESAFPGR